MSETKVVYTKSGKAMLASTQTVGQNFATCGVVRERKGGPHRVPRRGPAVRLPRSGCWRRSAVGRVAAMTERAYGIEWTDNSGPDRGADIVCYAFRNRVARAIWISRRTTDMRCAPGYREYVDRPSQCMRQKARQPAQQETP